MVKARNILKKHLSLVDLVLELVDARVPLSSCNQAFESLLKKKPRLIILNKAELADELQTRKWVAYWNQKGVRALDVDSISSRGIKKVVEAYKQMASRKIHALSAKGREIRPVRCMVIGIPNVGKSTFINRLVGKTTAKTGGKPGLTKGKQWIKIAGDLELLDTPGILPPRIKDPEVAFKLAVTGAISEVVYDEEELTCKLINWLNEKKPQVLLNLLKFENFQGDPLLFLELWGRKRGFLLSGGIVDTKKSAQVILSEFRKGKWGRFTMDELEP